MSCFLESWVGLIAQFTKRQPTRDDDQVMAIQGIAKLPEKTSRRRLEHSASWSQLQHFAGVWSESVRLTVSCEPKLNGSLLLATLFWRIRSPRLKPASDRAPSWSWISTDGEVSFALKDLSTTTWDTSVSQLIGIKAESKGSAFSGELTIEGYLVPTKSLNRAVKAGMRLSWDYIEARETPPNTFLLGVTLGVTTEGRILFGLVLSQVTDSKVEGQRFRRCGLFSLIATAMSSFVGQASGKTAVTII